MSRVTAAAVLALIIMVLAAGCATSDFYTSPLAVERAVEEGRSEINAREYLTFHLETWFPDNEKDEEYIDISYHLVIENSSDQTVRLYLQAYLPDKLTRFASDRPVFSRESRPAVLEPGDHLNLSSAVRFGPLTDQNRQVLMKWKDTIYLQLKLNGKLAYLAVSAAGKPGDETS